MAKRKTTRSTLASLAAELGVSRTTVSNAYNRPDQLSPALRERILAAATQRGYPGPNPAARSLRTRKTGTIGVLFTDHLSYAFEDLASVDFLAGMAEASHGSHTSLTLIPAGPGGTVDPQALVGQAVVDGFVVYSVAADDPYLEAAVSRHVPVVVVDQPTTTELPWVGIDDYHAIAPAAAALLEAGHRDIGILCIRLDRTPNNGFVDPERLASASLHVQQARVQGALAVLADGGIDPRSVPIVERHINDRSNNIDAARELLETHPRLTAVLCTTDSMALGVLELRPDISVTGFDGISTALSRNLATVIQPNRDKGITAGRMLATLIDAHLNDTPVAAPRTVLPTSYNPGATVRRI
ncbi:LacI family DNA-binding transcriptional regulator [Corynebacterium hindlerae]|uniref:LacI family DNA-binding transcriptional regulator n=1 Tax=Corynebacterium hindlerae TaxID=699041 RepID=UPI003AAE2362